MALTKIERELGYRQVPQPTERESKILQRIAAGFLLVTRHEGAADTYTYDDGTAIWLDRTERGRKRKVQMDARAFRRFAAHSWILPIDGENLLNEPLDAQRWRARTTTDPVLPRIVGGPR